MNDVVFEDRYTATGTPYPDENSCDECDGMGLFPCQVERLDEEALKTEDKTLTIIGQKDTDSEPMKFDGWVVVRCPACKGSRKKVSK